MRSHRRIIPAAWAAALGLVVSGCGGEGGPRRSPTPAEAPERYEQAKQQTEAANRESREAEQRALRGLDDPEADPGAPESPE